MTPEDFKRLEELGADAIRLKNRLERIRTASAVPATNYSSAGGRGGSADPVSRAVCREDDTRCELIATQNKMREIIATEGKEQMRDLLNLRFVDGLSWAKVADRLGYEAGSPVYKRFKRYRKKKMEMDMETKRDVK